MFILYIFILYYILLYLYIIFVKFIWNVILWGLFVLLYVVNYLNFYCFFSVGYDVRFGGDVGFWCMGGGSDDVGGCV